MTAACASWAVRSIAKRAAALLAASGAIVALIALGVVVTGQSADARDALRFGFAGMDPSIAQAFAIAIHNSRLAGATLACGVLAPRLHAVTRIPVHLLLALILVFNCAAVGVAFGAYGWRVIRATAPHLPLEFAALSLAGGAYLHACGQPLSTPTIAAVAATCALLLCAAAAIETYVWLGGTA